MAGRARTGWNGGGRKSAGRHLIRPLLADSFSIGDLGPKVPKAEVSLGVLIVRYREINVY